MLVTFYCPFIQDADDRGRAVRHRESAIRRNRQIRYDDGRVGRRESR